MPLKGLRQLANRGVCRIRQVTAVDYLTSTYGERGSHMYVHARLQSSGIAT